MTQEAIKFHLDEHVDHAVAAGLRARGIDVTTSTDAGLLNAPDSEQISFAATEARVFVTFDRDFLHPTQINVAHAGIVICRRSSRDVGYLVRYLTLMHDCLSATEMRCQVEFC